MSSVQDVKISMLVNGNRHLENKTPVKPIDAEELKLREASKKLEGQFLSLLIKSMENTIPKEDKGKQSMSTMMFSSVMGKQMSENGGIGLADFIYKSLKDQDGDSLNKISETDGYNSFYAPTLTGDNDE
jgi:Rod binding domain-containing protein